MSRAHWLMLFSRAVGAGAVSSCNVYACLSLPGGFRVWKFQVVRKAVSTYLETTVGLQTHEDYTIGWICALPVELTASIAMLDETHDPLPQDRTDDNTYTLGRIAKHNITIACLPYGRTFAQFGLV